MMVAIQDSHPPYDVQPTPAEPSDAVLAASGDRRAFERLYRTHVGRVYALCARMCADRTLAEELTQDVFVRAWEKLASFRGESSFGTWIHRVAVNVVLNRLQVEKRDRKRSALRVSASFLVPKIWTSMRRMGCLGAPGPGSSRGHPP